MKYDVINDLLMVKKMLNITDEKLSSELLISRSTLNRWINGKSEISNRSIKGIYEYIYSKNIDVNKIKSQLYLEEYSKENEIVLFHGSKTGIEGNIDLNKTKINNDFGQGFYCGETFEQAAMFVSSYSTSSIYIIKFKSKNLKVLKFDVDTKWMFAIAYYRGRLDEYKDSKVIKEIDKEVKDADYIIAPIADNKMFSIISNFIDGEITDEQCRHSLSATDLGYQYIFISNKAIDNLGILSNCYITEKEKEDYLKSRETSIKLGNDKVKAARIKYARIGKYIDDIMGE